MILLTGADIMMTTSIEAGAVLYIAGYVLLCMDFIKENKPGAVQILIVLDTARGSSFAFHLFSAALHYIALSMLASTGSGITLQGIMQEPAVKAAETCPPPDKGV